MTESFLKICTNIELETRTTNSSEFFFFLKQVCAWMCLLTCLKLVSQWFIITAQRLIPTENNIILKAVVQNVVDYLHLARYSQFCLSHFKEGIDKQCIQKRVISMKCLETDTCKISATFRIFILKKRTL